MFVFLIGGLQWVALAVLCSWIVWFGSGVRRDSTCVATRRGCVRAGAHRVAVHRVDRALPAVLAATAIGTLGLARLTVLGAVALALLGFAGSGADRG